MPHKMSEGRCSLLALVAVALCSGLLGCDGLGYTPSGEHFVEVEPPAVEGVTLELVGSDEVLVARGRVVLQYRLELGGRYINEIVVAAEPEEGAEIPLGSTHDYERFVFDSSELENGRYTLHLRVRTNSGSGSLADVLGAEQLILTLSQPISVENGTPAVAFTSVARVDGRVVIEWEPSRRVGFEYYELKRIYWSGSSWYDVLGPTRITNREATRFEDRAFVGGRVRYELTVGASGEDPHYTTIEHAEPPPQPLATSRPAPSTQCWRPAPPRRPGPERGPITRRAEPWAQTITAPPSNGAAHPPGHPASGEPCAPTPTCAWHDAQAKVPGRRSGTRWSAVTGRKDDANKARE